MRILCAGLVVLLAVLAGCNDNELGIKKRRPNRPPETILASGPADSALSTPYKVHLYWSGSDPDGTIDHYDFILVDHPALDDHIKDLSDSTRLDTTRVVVTVPELDDPRWTATSAKDSLFTTRADTLRRDPRPGPGEPPDVVRDQSFERWHTFFVRAVDNEGMPDPIPDYRSFNARTVAPTLGLKDPVKAGDPFRGPRVIVFKWDGDDPVGDGNFQKPIASRWVCIPSRRSAGGTYTSFPESLYHLPSRGKFQYKWSPWARWDAADKSGVQAIVRDLKTPDEGGGSYIFAVEALDDAGAVSPVFDYKTPGKNNVALVAVNKDVGARLTVEDRYLGTFYFVSGALPQRLDAAAGQQIRFKWRGDASSYGGDITAYRYGWNIRNLSNDEEWEQGWSLVADKAPPRSFASGTQYFFLETRDNAETVTHAEFEINVHSVRRTHEVMLVDDTFHIETEPERLEDQRWMVVLDSLQARHPFDFNPGRDVYDVQDNGGSQLPPSIESIFDYKTIIWTMSGDSKSTSALKTLARFWDPYLPSSGSFNYLNIYLENRGKLWVSGWAPGTYVWSADPTFPVNVTNWDDPAHRGIDSVGTVSFLYKMGVELLDFGCMNSLSVPRSNVFTYGCRGLRRAVSPGSRLQTFTTSDTLAHEHTISRPDSEWAGEIDAAPVAGTDYTTSETKSHTHEFHVTQEQFQVLGRGGMVTVTTTEWPRPEPHTHTITLVDRVGLWGAPPSLQTDPGSWPWPSIRENVEGVRPNIEIYNMPELVGQLGKPLRMARSLTLYTYVAASLSQGPGKRYPETADGQPVFVLGKGSESDPSYTRAFCGFEPYLLTLRSQVALAEFVLGRHFRVGQSEAP